MSKYLISFFPVVLIFILQVALSFKMSYTEEWSFSYSLYHLVATSLSIFLFYMLVLACLTKVKKNLAITIHLVFYVFYLMLLGYHWIRHEPLSYVLLIKNGAAFFNVEGVKFAASNLTVGGVSSLIITLFVSIFMGVRFKAFTQFYYFNINKYYLAIILLLNSLVVITFPRASNEVYELAASAYRQLSPYKVKSAAQDIYPYYKEVIEAQEVNVSENKDKPHVFIVMLESFSAFYMDRVENGKPVTPFIDELKNEGVFVEEFLSSSVETSKGQFSTLCSVYPSYRQNVFTGYAENHFRCLPQILKENGYTNVFLKAYHSLKFENTGNFFRANGFDHAYGMDENFVTREERKKYKFGWGIQDDIFYKKIFEYLDRLEAKTPNAHYFVKTMSVTNHMMFDSIPEDQRYIYPNAKSHHENYTNSMHLTDKYLREFFKQLKSRDYLKNSLILILGDNGFPMGQHRNNFHNTKTAFNEMFKTPLLVLWPENLKPTRISKEAFSQLDVAPTILDLLGIKTSHHFVGHSIFKPKTSNYFVPLVQPFDGTYLSSIRYPFKIIKHLKTGKETFYNLDTDPDEKNILPPEDINPILIQKLQDDLNRFHLNETILSEDRIYPPSKVSSNIFLRVVESSAQEESQLYFEILGDDSHANYLEAAVHHFDAGQEKYVEEVHELKLKSSRAIPNDWLGQGVNRIVFRLLDDQKEPLAIVSRDVYVPSKATKLMTSMNLKGEQGWGKLRKNLSVTKKPLSVASQRFSYGLGTHSDSKYTADLSGKYQWFSVTIGLDDSSSCGDGAIFEIYADDKTLFSQKLKNYERQDLFFNVAGKRKLKLVTLSGRHRNCDHTNWLNPVLFK